MLLVIDNYDSFVHNLARYFRRLGQTTQVVRNDAITISDIERMSPAAIILSPGPCTPHEAGCSLEIVKSFSGRIPLLGVCLGHQTIGAALGGRVIRAQVPLHGRTSLIEHTGDELFNHLPQPLQVSRYHSLVVEEESLPAELRVVARSAEGEIMALGHRQHCTWGVQFHPEAVLTEGGYRLLANFLRLAGCPLPSQIPSADDERPAETPVDNDWTRLPLTF